MTIVQLRDQVIEEGIASVLAKETGAKQRGALLGFERCRDLYIPAQFEAVLRTIHEEERVLRHLHQKRLVTLDDYWAKVYEGLQVDHVFRVLRVGWGLQPFYARAVEQYARIVGVKYDGER